jgi:hypothetical protein
VKYFLPQKLSLSSQKYGFGIRDLEKTYPGSRIQGVKKAPDPGYGSATLVTRVPCCTYVKYLKGDVCPNSLKLKLSILSSKCGSLAFNRFRKSFGFHSFPLRHYSHFIYLAVSNHTPAPSSFFCFWQNYNRYVKVRNET